MRVKHFRSAILTAAALAAISPMAASAQVDNATTTDTQYDTRTTEREDNDFPWGLLGLLGLAGLLGRKKRDADIHVDARHNTRP
jgi:MYXO-CTERM domain-containing protein